MALDAHLLARRNDRPTRAPVASLEERHLVALDALVEAIRLRTGLVLDAYAKTVFAPETLPALRAAIDEALAELARGPRVHRAHLGTEVLQRREIIVDVPAAELVQRLEALRDAVDRGRAERSFLVFLGD
jgi:hypothetical protein